MKNLKSKEDVIWSQVLVKPHANWARCIILKKEEGDVHTSIHNKTIVLILCKNYVCYWLLFKICQVDWNVMPGDNLTLIVDRVQCSSDVAVSIVKCRKQLGCHLPRFDNINTYFTLRCLLKRIPFQCNINGCSSVVDTGLPKPVSDSKPLRPLQK